MLSLPVELMLETPETPDDAPMPVVELAMPVTFAMLVTLAMPVTLAGMLETLVVLTQWNGNEGRAAAAAA